MDPQPFSRDALRIDPEAETARIGAWLRRVLSKDLRRRGLVVGLSGGVDSTVTAALAVRALGRERVFGLLMPEHHSDSDTVTLSSETAEFLGVEHLMRDISPILETVGFYSAYAEAVRQVIPGYGTGWESKIVTPDVRTRRGFTYFDIVARGPDGTTIRERLPARCYLEIVAATNFKQRIRKMLEYYHADRLNYAVAGTPNRLEFDQGFFVKNGDGSADVKPIAHLYKTQVYELAEYLDVPESIRSRAPTTDTYSMPQGQDEFYFSLPYQQMDLCLYAKNHDVSREAAAEAAGLTPEEVDRVWRDIDTKRSTTRYAHLKPLVVEDIGEIDA